ncbi:MULTISPECIES: putative minor capsid protein [Bacillus cereus group]|uniref:putative minor capsid protein n=1 Tax=Bacillus cereus group TaxID=86661 RepID=UPI000994154B|nr:MULTISPECIES: putative minor capsid protein [Bacillus cereus group]OOR18164.1 minor capsid protein [Bacillus mycoides]QWG81347.1 minor capsid protein [Bacillus mycoides]TXR90664.1 minor capsid protein [Bacillus sp. AR13-1]
MAKPIRRSLLIHTIEYFEYKGEDDTWSGSDNYEPAVTIERVRVEPKNTVVSNGNGESLVTNTLLFHDSVHSTPVVFKEKSKVIFNGKEMIVKKAAEFYDRSSLHHVEVMFE